MLPESDEMHHWLKVEPRVVSHRKTKALARRWGCEPYMVAGFLLAFWGYLLDYQSDGRAADVPREDLEELAEPCLRVGRAPDYVIVHDVLADLKEAGFVDPDGMAHDWQVYAGALLTARERDRDRKREERAGVRGTSEGRPPVEEEKRKRKKEQPPAARGNWVAPFVDLHRAKAGDPPVARMGKALKAVRDLLVREYPTVSDAEMERGLLVLFGRWLDAGKAQYGPENFARSWKQYTGLTAKDAKSKQAVEEFLRDGRREA